ncbi:MAG TPA: hypothetical protein VIR57_19245, partial [Chloroflexota bacterium]
LPDDRLGFLAGAQTIYGLFDPDAAGDAAAARAGDQLGPRFRALALPAGCDLSDLGCRPDGRATFFEFLATARDEARRDLPTGDPAGHIEQFEQREVTYAHSH